LAHKVLSSNRQSNQVRTDQFEAPKTDAESRQPQFEQSKSDRLSFNARHDARDLDRLSWLLAQAVEGTGLLPGDLRRLLDEWDLEEAIAGRFPLTEMKAYARSFAEGVASGRICILESQDHYGIRSNRE